MNSQEILILLLAAIPIALIVLIIIRPALWWLTGRKQQLKNQETIINLLQGKTDKKEAGK